MIMISLATLMLGGSMSAPAADTTVYSVVRLPSVDGASFRAVDLNDHGAIVGNVDYGPVVGKRATVWTGERGFVTLQKMPFGRHTRAEGINNAGQVVGSASVHAGAGSRAVRWEADGSINPMDGFAGDSHGYGISQNGDIVGQTYGAPSMQYQSAFFWSPSRGIVLGMGDNGDSAHATGVSSSGMAVGIREIAYAPWGLADLRAFVWDANGGMRDIPIPKDQLSFGYAINERNQVVGQDRSRAFFIDPRRGLVTIDVGPSSTAWDINDAGVVVGSAGSRPFIWDLDRGGRMLDEFLAEPIVADSLQAKAINNAGQVLLVADFNTSSPSVFYLLTPDREVAP